MTAVKSTQYWCGPQICLPHNMRRQALLLEQTLLGWLLPGQNMVPDRSPALTPMLTSMPRHTRACSSLQEHGDGLDEHPKSQQGYFGSLLAPHDDRERVIGGVKGTIGKGEKDPKRAQGGITRAGGKGREGEGRG